jgi:hypothetical protein
MDDLDTIKARIRKLMARTTANGCTEAEAMAAAAKAMAMMREHGLSPDQIECGQHSIPLGRRRAHVMDLLWSRIAHVCRCQNWRADDGRVWHVVYFGREPWPEIAAWLHGVVQGAHKRGMRDFTKGGSYKARRTNKTRAAARLAFSEGFVLGVNRQLLDLLLPAEEAERAADQALAKRALDALGIEFGKAKGPKLGGGGGQFERDRIAGAISGRGTTLHWGVGKAAQGRIGGSA